MKIDNINTRRNFLRNVSIGSLALGLMPGLSKGTDKSNNIAASCEKTTLDYYGVGPFYTENPPYIENNKLARNDEPGSRLILSGRVFNLDCTQNIPGTIIDVWQANGAGQYDNSGYNLRGKTTSNEQGFYQFETIIPGKYLNGSRYRPAHIHFKITAPGFPTLITQLYFEGDTDIPMDSAASIKSGEYNATYRIIPITMNNDGIYEGTWDIVVNGNGSTGVNDIHTNKGMIYSVNPNPFSDEVEIYYGVFEQANVSILVYDITGRLVADLEKRIIPAEKYKVYWNPPASLPNGSYFIALKINDMQVHYMKAQLKR